MLKKSLVLAGLLASTLPINAEIIDLGSITRDTDTGLDWLDLTETAGRSYNDISSQFGVGGEFEGWRYATSVEAQTLWANIGVVNQSQFGSDIPTADPEYQYFLNAVDLLGNTFLNYDVNPELEFDYGVEGITGTLVTEGFGPDGAETIGMYHQVGAASSTSSLYGNQTNVIWVGNDANSHLGSYLVAPSAVPVPAAAWLFGSALIGLMGIKRKK